MERGVALLCALLANQDRDQKKRPEPFLPEDFMEHLDRPKDTLEEALGSWS